MHSMILHYNRCESHHWDAVAMRLPSKASRRRSPTSVAVVVVSGSLVTKCSCVLFLIVIESDASLLFK